MKTQKNNIEYIWFFGDFEWKKRDPNPGEKSVSSIKNIFDKFNDINIYPFKINVYSIIYIFDISKLYDLEKSSISRDPRNCTSVFHFWMYFPNEIYLSLYTFNGHHRNEQEIG